jgi:uncharacterized OsmC-like protein
MEVSIEALEVKAERVFNPEKLNTVRRLLASYKEVRIKACVNPAASREVLDKMVKAVKKQCPIADSVVNQILPSS